MHANVNTREHWGLTAGVCIAGALEQLVPGGLDSEGSSSAKAAMAWCVPTSCQDVQGNTDRSGLRAVSICYMPESLPHHAFATA
jgi:hypothetical protein